MATTNFISRNRINDASELVIKRNAPIEVLQNKAGKYFFACGNNPDGSRFGGYCSPAAAKKWAEADSKLSDFQYAEVKDAAKPDTDAQTGKSNWVPCLMVKGTGAPSLGVKGMELLRPE